MRIISILSLFCLSGFSTQAQKFHTNEDFNSGALPVGWSSTIVSGNTAWSFGIDGSAFEPGNNNIDNTAMAYFDDDALSGSNLNNTSELYTPVFDNSIDSITYLEFDFNFRSYPPANDSFAVEVFDGTNWVYLISIVSDSCGRYSQPNNMHKCALEGFPSAFVNISAFKNSNCQVRFRYHDGDDWGWYAALDNVKIYSFWEKDLTVSRIMYPENSCGLTANENIIARIKNVGVDTIRNFSINFNVDHGLQTATEAISVSIPPYDSLDYTFNTNIDLSAIKDYQFLVYTALAADQEQSNDTLKKTISNQAIKNLPYSQSFEANLDDWTISGVNSTLISGIPNNTAINTASDGQVAIVTNLNGSHNNDEVSYLTSPCLDFSATPFPAIHFDLNFKTEVNYDYLIMESSIDNGQSWQKVNSSFKAQNWYNRNIVGIGETWNGNSQGWVPVENGLASLGNEPRVKLRFAFMADGGVVDEGFAVDNFAFNNADSINLEINELLYPAVNSLPICGYQNTGVSIEIENEGYSAVDTVFVSYQVGTSAISTDTLINTIGSFGKINYTFKNTYDFSAQTNFSLSVWLSAKGDTIQSDDSLMNLSFNNPAIPITNLPFLEDFETFSPGSGANNQGFANANGWVSIPDRLNDYAWGARNTPTSSLNTGPLTDHSLNGNTFIYTEASFGNSGDIAILESPCISLLNANNTQLEFYYHKYGSSVSDLFIDVFDGNQWIIGYDTVVGQTHFSNASEYLKKEVDLSAFKNRTVKTRFRTIKNNLNSPFNNDVAIDEVIIYDQKATDSRLNILFPPDNSCNLDSNELIAVEIENFGSLAISANSIEINYQVDNSNIIKDTLKTLLEPDSSVLFTFSTTANFSIASKVYNVSAWTNLIGDTETYNDSILNLKVENLRRTNGYLEDFESFIDNDCFLQANQVLMDGWTAINLSGSAFWTLQDLAFCPPNANGATPSSQTGPAGDHTRGFGKLMYLQTNSATSPGRAELISACLDLTNETSASLSFWYHKYGVNIGDLSLLAKNDTSAIWDTLITIVGQTQNSHQDPWLQSTVSLTNYLGNNFKVKFVGTSVGGFRGDAAIDDIEIFDPLLTEIRESENYIEAPTLYPNPNDGTFTMSVPESFLGKQFQLFDIKGKVVQTGRLSQQKQEFEIQNKKSGMYFIRVPELNFSSKIIVY